MQNRVVLADGVFGVHRHRVGERRIVEFVSKNIKGSNGISLAHFIILIRIKYCHRELIALHTHTARNVDRSPGARHRARERDRRDGYECYGNNNAEKDDKESTNNRGSKPS